MKILKSSFFLNVTVQIKLFFTFYFCKLGGTFELGKPFESRSSGSNIAGTRCFREGHQNSSDPTIPPVQLWANRILKRTWQTLKAPSASGTCLLFWRAL